LRHNPRSSLLADAGTAVLVIAPRPSPPGNEETKASILGPFYLTELRTELVGKTLLGLRVDDVIAAIDAPEDILPGVLLHYDIPDLIRALGPRLTLTNPQPGTANLSASPDSK
jgi:hypothetical protein